MGEEMKNLLCYEIKRFPDLRMQKYLSIYGSWSRARNEVFLRQKAFLSFIHDLGEKISISIRYDYNPERDGFINPKLRVYLLIRNDSPLASSKLDTFIREGFLKDFYSLAPDEKYLREERFEWVSSISSILRYEEKVEPLTRVSPIPYYYLIFPFEPNNENDFVFLDGLLETSNKKIVIDITVSPYKISENEEKAIKNMITLLEGANRASFSEGLRKKDVTVDTALRLFEDFHTSFLADKVFKYCVRVLTDDPQYGNLIASTIALSATLNNKYRIVSFTDSRNAKEEINRITSVSPESQIRWDEFWREVKSTEPTILAMKNFCHIITLTELSSFFRIIVPGIQPLRTLKIETDPFIHTSQPEKSIEIGIDEVKGTVVKIPLEQMKKHMFVSGVTGSGKTTTILNILAQLWNEYNIPFLVIEPAKREYRILKTLKNLDNPAAKKLGNDLRIFTLGEERISPFRFNPFEFPEKISLNENIGMLDTCFQGALPLWNPLPAIISEATEHTYARHGWNPLDIGENWKMDERKIFPIMEEFYRTALEVAQSKRYSSDVSKDITTAIEVRLGTLLRRSVGPMLNSICSLPSIEELMKYPTILEMDYLNEEQANLMTMFILAQILEYIRSTRHPHSPLTHVIVLEEAHNIVGAVPQMPSTGEFANPKGEATKFLTKMLSEIRTYGEGLIIADQIPSRMAPDVIKNTSIKIIHRIVAGDDREIIGQTMTLTPSQAEEVARCSSGEAFFYVEGIYFPFKIKCTNFYEKYKGVPLYPPSGDEIIEYIKDEEWYKRYFNLRMTFEKVNTLLREIIETHSTFARKIDIYKIRLERISKGDFNSPDELKFSITQMEKEKEFIKNFLEKKLNEEIVPVLENVRKIDEKVWKTLFKRVKIWLEEMATPSFNTLYNQYQSLLSELYGKERRNG